MMKNVFYFLGCTQNYSYQFSATNTKVEFLAKGLNQIGDSCIIHNGIIGTKLISQKEIKEISNVGTVITYSKKGNQLISWIFNLPLLIKDLNRNDVKGEKVIILEAPDYHIYLLYIILARIFKYKIIVISHEWSTTVTSVHWLRKPSVTLYSSTFGYFADGILPISEFIIKKISHFKKPYLKIPVIAEYNQIVRYKPCENKKYFLYCVSAAYKRVIFQIINAFVKFNTEERDVNLVLVLSGTTGEISIIQAYINQFESGGNIIIKNKVSYTTLLALYSNALALIVPLDPNCKQDEARFSQKIAEYLSSGTPVISNNVGEIKYYFKDKENIVLCDYSVRGFVEAFRWVYNYPKEAKEIGINGFNTGKKYFEYHKISKELHDFVSTL